MWSIALGACILCICSTAVACVCACVCVFIKDRTTETATPGHSNEGLCSRGFET